APKELSHKSYVLDFIAADWPSQLRGALEPHCAAICYAVNQAAEHRTLRKGSIDLLHWAAKQRLPVVVVSNALSGAVHRDFLAAAGLSDYLTAELYSDELGIRKPNPALLAQGAAAAGVEVGDCWYVGDHLDRDVLCGERAGIGVNVLMDDPAKSTRPFAVPVTEDLSVADPAELLSFRNNTPTRLMPHRRPNMYNSAHSVVAPVQSNTIAEIFPATQLRDIAAEAATCAGTYLASVFREPVDTEFKCSPHDQVTKHDRAAEQRVRDVI